MTDERHMRIRAWLEKCSFNAFSGNIPIPPSRQYDNPNDIVDQIQYEKGMKNLVTVLQSDKRKNRSNNGENK